MRNKEEINKLIERCTDAIVGMPKRIGEENLTLTKIIREVAPEFTEEQAFKILIISGMINTINRLRNVKDPFTEALEGLEKVFEKWL